MDCASQVQTPAVACDSGHMMQQCTRQLPNLIGCKAAVIRVDTVGQMASVPLPIRRENLR
jgi:hypothetical protein